MTQLGTLIASPQHVPEKQGVEAGDECSYALVTEDLEKHPYLRVGSRKRSVHLSPLEMLEQWIVEVV